MNVYELNAGQMHELKGSYIDEKNQERGVGTSYWELADADELVSDEEVFAEYGGVDFSPDDFGCTAGWPEYTCDDGSVVIPESVAGAIEPRLDMTLQELRHDEHDGTKSACFELWGSTDCDRDLFHFVWIRVDDLESVAKWREALYTVWQSFSPWKETCKRAPFDDGDAIYEDFRAYAHDTLETTYDELMRIRD